MARRAGSHRARWLVACLAPAALSACRVTDERFVEPAAAPRLIAPSSLGRVTLLKPRLLWTLGPGEGASRVELCTDRACTVPIATPLSDVTATGDGLLSAVPKEALPLGWIYWRVHVTLGDQEQVSPTWQFWVTRSASGTPVDADTTSSVIFDVNGDGFADFLVGAPAVREPNDTGGHVYVYLGSGAPMAAGWNGASPARRIDIVVPADVNNFAAMAVAPVGDVNGDGFADFLVGDPFAIDGTGTTVGATFLYFGSPEPTAEGWNGASAHDRFDLPGPDGPAAAFGEPAVALGDVNRDGFADFLVASSPFSGMQPVHVYLGTATPGAGWTGGDPPLRIELMNPDGVHSIFNSAASAGDVNGDGYPDFLVGTSGIDGNGAAHLYLGSATPGRATWNGDVPGARIDVASPDGAASKFFSVAGAGDVNGDGYSDVLVGAGGSKGGLGAAHLFLGARDPAAAWAGAAPAARIDLVSPDATMSEFGDTVSGAGDVNGDGLADFAVTGFGPNFGRSNSGTSHVYLGMRTPTAAAWNGVAPPQRVDLISPDGVNGGYAGMPPTNGGLNKDLYDDFAISSPDANGKVGAVYVYFGSGAPDTAGWNGAAPARRMTLTGPDAAGSEYGTMH